MAPLEEAALAEVRLLQTLRFAPKQAGVLGFLTELDSETLEGLVPERWRQHVDPVVSWRRFAASALTRSCTARHSCRARCFVPLALGTGPALRKQDSGPMQLLLKKPLPVVGNSQRPSRGSATQVRKV